MRSSPDTETAWAHPAPPAQKERGPLEAYENLKKLIADAEQDMPKALGGNKAAQTRVRKVMQDIKEAAQSVRASILEIRKQEPQEGQ